MNTSAVMSSAQMNELGTIWAIVETRKALPAVIVVMGATQADDTEAISRGLAQVADAAGQRAGYFRLKTGAGAKSALSQYATLVIGSSGSQRESFDASLTSWRTMYDVVIVDAGTSGAEPLGVHAARVGDGVVIAACEQRKVVPADRTLARVLKEIHASVIGVVMTAAAGSQKPVAVLDGRSSLVPVVQTK
jgi:hypothetical protein